MASLSERLIPGAVALKWQALALAVISLPHLWRLPWWAPLLVIGCLFWRYHSHRFNLPGRFARLLLVVALVFLTLNSLGFRGAAVDVSVALLFGGIFLKLLEMRNTRDYLFVSALAFLLVTTQFIYSQGIPVAVYAFVSVYLLLISMISVHRTGDAARGASTVVYGGQLMLHSLPMLLVMFLLVPRIAPLWSMPSPSETAVTGVGDTMSPGDITRLGRSGALALRVRFDDAPPPPEHLYWRGLVLENFDGRVWRRSEDDPVRSRHSVTLSRAAADNTASYDVIMEPSGRDWVYTLETSWSDTPGLWQDVSGVFYSGRTISRRLSYNMTAWREAALESSGLSMESVQRNLYLPDTGNERSRALARQWRQEAGDDAAFIRRALSHFREQPYYYTLSPLPLATNVIDEFLFETREGFCEHYAGALVFLLRSAGIPARVVVGYQGGEFNRFDDYLMVYQYNAHAWVEYWSEGIGWQRVDPTMAVAPSRILDGAEQWFATQQGFLGDTGLSMIRFRGTPWLNTLRLRIDALDHAWTRWVLAYDAGMQNRLVQRLTGWSGTDALIRALAVGAVFALMICTLLVFRSVGRRQQKPVLKLYQSFIREMARRGITREVGEGPYDFLARVRQSDPAVASHAESITRRFTELHYQSEEDVDYRKAVKALRTDVRALTGIIRRPV